MIFGLFSFLQTVNSDEKAYVSNENKNVRKVNVYLIKKNRRWPVNAEVVVEACFHAKTTAATTSTFVYTTQTTVTGKYLFLFDIIIYLISDELQIFLFGRNSIQTSDGNKQEPFET